MILPLDDKYRIKSETHQWIIQKARKRKKDGALIWESFAYFSNFESCFKRLGEVMIRELDTHGLEDLVRFTFFPAMSRF